MKYALRWEGEIVNGRCETCKHWVPFGAVHRGNTVREVTVECRDRKLGLCQKASGVAWNEDDPRDPESLSYAEDASNYESNFRTDAKFGCVMYEAKP
jgi:hypothetical protein